MAAYTGHSENRGSIAKNDYKKEEKDPDFRGTLNIKGVHHYLAGWKDTFKNGDPKLNLSIGNVVEGGEQAPASKPAKPADDFF